MADGKRNAAMTLLAMCGRAAAIVLCGLLIQCTPTEGHQEDGQTVTVGNWVTGQTITPEQAEWCTQEWNRLRFPPFVRSSPDAYTNHVIPRGTAVTVYDNYVVITWEHGSGEMFDPIGALILDGDGEAIWAGIQAFPMRWNGEVTSLILIEDPWLGNPRDSMGIVSWLDMTREPAGDSGEFTDGHPYHVLGRSNIPCKVDPEDFDARRISGVVDVDGDGTDEFLLVDGPMRNRGYDWRLALFEQMPRADPEGSSNPLAVLAIQGDSTFESAADVTEFTLLLQWFRQSGGEEVNPAHIDWQRTEDGKGIVLMHYTNIVLNDDGSQPGIIGTLTRNEETGRFVFARPDPNRLP